MDKIMEIKNKVKKYSQKSQNFFYAKVFNISESLEAKFHKLMLETSLRKYILTMLC